jgi:hypothetical protein
MPILYTATDMSGATNNVVITNMQTETQPPITIIK